MQIPSPEQQKVIKGIALRALIGELVKSRFSGHCAMPIAGAVASMVFEEGNCVLAEYRGIRGLDALESIRAIGDPVIDVVISPFDREQVAGIIRANQASFVEPLQEGKPRPEGETRTTIIRPISIGGTAGRPVKVIAVKAGKKEKEPPPVLRREKVPASRAAAGTAAGGGNRMERPLDRKGLETIKSMKDSFRTDAADLLSELNLGHLVVNRSKTDKGKGGEGAEKGDTG